MERANRYSGLLVFSHGGPKPATEAGYLVTDSDISAHRVFPGESLAGHDRYSTATISQKCVFNGISIAPTFMLLIALYDKSGSNTLLNRDDL